MEPAPHTPITIRPALQVSAQRRIAFDGSPNSTTSCCWDQEAVFRVHHLPQLVAEETLQAISDLRVVMHRRSNV